MIYSSSYIWAEYKYGDALKFVKAESLFLILGIVLMLIVSKIDYMKYYKNANKILVICVLLLILVLIPGIGTIRNGSRSWFGLGSFGIQPSEFTKLSLIIFTSKYLSNNDKLLKNIKKGVLPILGLLLTIFGLIMLQPDFGTGTVIVISIVAILFVSGVDFSFFCQNSNPRFTWSCSPDSRSPIQNAKNSIIYEPLERPPRQWFPNHSKPIRHRARRTTRPRLRQLNTKTFLSTRTPNRFYLFNYQ